MFLFFSLKKCLQSTAAVPIKPVGTRKNVLQKPPLRTGQVNKVGSPKSSQASGANFDTKLVEMINTAIVDRSPSIRWEDVGKNLCMYASLFYMLSFLWLLVWKCSRARKGKAIFNGDGYFAN